MVSGTSRPFDILNVKRPGCFVVILEFYLLNKRQTYLKNNL